MYKNIKSKVKLFLYIVLKNTILYSYWNKRKLNKELYELKKNEKNISLINNLPKIEVVNFNANDICNSKCVMCNIWKRKQEEEITPKELSITLKDSFFKNVKNVGITGGEPTLRKDIGELFKTFINEIPSVSGLSIITNCIKEQGVKKKIDEVIEICKVNNKSFSIMLSLDGYGKTHDRIRGRKGNFESTINVLNYYMEKKVSVITACTISKNNVWEVDELLSFVKNNNFYSRFRVAEFINRLYNSQNEGIRNFNEDETYNLILFFYKLILTFEKNKTIIRTYKSIINILSGGKRLIGCPYKNSEGVLLNSKGELAYCAPKSKILGRLNGSNGIDIYMDNIGEKNNIITNYCDSCIHDYHSPITYSERLNEIEIDKWKKYIHVDSKIKSIIHRRVSLKKTSNFQVFITGWYGTETVGDKAILAGIVNELEEKYFDKNISIVITSFYPIITERTLKELGINNAKVIQVYSESFISYIKGSKIVIMGGGPLMDIGALALPFVAFTIAKKYDIKTEIFGCGIGPLFKEKYLKVVKQILFLSDEIKLRDNLSIHFANKLLNNSKNVIFSGDPAKNYIKKLKLREINNTQDNKLLKCYLRELTYEYNLDISEISFNRKRLDFEESLSNFIKYKAEQINATEIYLDHMHNFASGNDDRDFSRYFINKYFNNYKIAVNYNKKLSSVDSIINSMLNSKYNVCMRFHSVLFADTLGTDYTAIDYTNGGKILGYLIDNKKTDKLLSLEKLLDNY